ncbi:MAG: UvrB/UvrC motif-containing protein, partial [bacterium]
CATCGTSFEEVKTHYKMGCSDCYNNFSDKGGKLEGLLRGIHGKWIHKESARKGDRDGYTDADFRLEMNIQDLEERMKQLVTDESFEEAATVRDELKGLQTERNRRTLHE